MERKLPENFNLEHLKSQAKDLHRQLRAANPDARLHQAQHQLAREYGFSSWPDMVGKLREAELARESFAKVIQIVEHGIRGDRFATDARRVMEIHPRMAYATAATACATLNLEAIREKLDSARVNEPVGDLKAPPIVYAAFSCFAKERPADYESAIRQLLEWGADPSTEWNSPDWEHNPLSVLYAASGVNRSVAATKLLLDAGANTDDNESLYHACETRDHSCLKLLLDAGAKIDGTNATLRMLDYEDLDGLNLLLEKRPNLDEPSALIHAMRRNRGDAILRRLVEAGADPNHRDRHGVTPMQVAFERKRSIFDPSYQPTDADRLLEACWRGDVAEAARYRPAYDDLPVGRRKAICDACWVNRPELIDAFFAGGFQHTDRDDSQGTPLHVACFTGSLALVEAILPHNPPLDDANDMYNAIPMQWAVHASEFARPLPEPGEHLAVVKRMIEAGSPPPTRLFGSEEVRALLREAWPDLPLENPI